MRKLVLITVILSILFSCKKPNDPSTPNFTDTTHHDTTTTINNGLVAYYSFNGNANDSVNGLNGTVHGAILIKDRFGNANSAYYFTGTRPVDDTVSLSPWDEILVDTSTYIQINDNPLLHFSINNKMSISFWSKLSYNTRTLNDLGGTVIAIAKTDSFTTTQTGFQCASIGHVVVWDGSYGIFTGANLGFITNNNNLTSTSPLVGPSSGIDTNWHHIVFTFNNGLGKTYIDTSLVDSTISSTHLIDNTNPLLFGKCNPDTRPNIFFNPGPGELYYNYYGFTGALDDIKIYNRDITRTEINTLYHQAN
jgi:hypothetical protein